MPLLKLINMFGHYTVFRKEVTKPNYLDRSSPNSAPALNDLKFNINSLKNRKLLGCKFLTDLKVLVFQVYISKRAFKSNSVLIYVPRVFQ